MSNSSNFSKYIKWMWIAFTGAIAFVSLLFIMASYGLFGTMPSFEELENPESNLATEIISSDGVTIGKFFSENRTPVKYSDLPPHLIHALVSTEDERFYSHSGIDARGTFRALFSLGSKGGASTITQQLSKLLFHGEGSRNIVLRILQKLKEWIIAIRLERQYTKNEILTMYLNKVDFVNTAVGIRSASRVYFSKEPKDLTVEEAAVFVGMLTNPSLFNPVRRIEKATERRNVVLKQMNRNDYLSERAKDSLQKTPLTLHFTPDTHNDGIATYYREYLRDFMKKWVKENPKPDGTEYNIYRDGLKIYTTIDSRMQRYAEEAMQTHMTNLQSVFNEESKKNKTAPFRDLSTEQVEGIYERAMKSSERWRLMKAQGLNNDQIRKSFSVKTKMRVFNWKGDKDTLMTPMDSIKYYKHFLHTGMMAMEPQTGQIKVWIGGINQKHFKYDHVNQGARQVGSTFKPIVYATAMDQLHYSPCDSIIDAPFTMPVGRYGILESWSPTNSDGKYTGMQTLKSALAKSINTASAKLIDRVGPSNVVQMAKKLGISNDMAPRPSIALGATEITVHDMVGAYSTFANQGIYIEPQFITSIVDKNGVILHQSVPKTKDVLNKDVSYAVVKLLEGVTQFGSGVRLRTNSGGPSYKAVTGHPYKFTNPIAGKTGTTQNQSDGWFIGMVPNLVSGVWVGGDDRATHFRGIINGQGATMALPIWGIFMKKCYADPSLNVSKGDFERPKNLSIKVDCTKADVVPEGEEEYSEEFTF